MRPFPLVGFVLLGAAVHAQDVRINELVASHHALEGDTAFRSGDMIELYNPGRKDVDLQGYAIVLNGAMHRIDASLRLPAKGLRSLWCDRRPALGPDHLDLHLSRKGGTALLVAPDRTTIVDLFTWPALPDDVSLGRRTDGGSAWGFFERSTPGAPNDPAAAKTRCLHAPVLRAENGVVTITADADVDLHYTLDGSAPSPNVHRYAGPFPALVGTVVRARAFAPDAVPGPASATTVLGDPRAFALVVDSLDLWDPQRGIHVEGASGNFARRGPAWRRQSWAEWTLGDERRSSPVGVAIAGSGSRSLPKKNFKLFARSRFGADHAFDLPDGAWDEVVLRADATPHAFLHNLFLEQVAARSSAHLDVQPATVVELQLNGRYQGLYRLMPAKNGEWVEHLSGAEAVDLIDGPGAHALEGDARRHQRLLAAIERGSPIDTLEALMDVRSLIDLACLDLWTGRADHDLNVRCWRPRAPGGRWRWILFDMDLWTPPDEHTVERLCAATGPEAPYVPQLLRNPATRDRLLARTVALIATTLDPVQALPLADSLFAAHAPALQRDHARWSTEMNMPAPQESLMGLQQHIRARGPVLLDQLADRTGLALRSLDLGVEPAQGGTLLIEDLPWMPGHAVQAFRGVPLHVRAVPAPGMEFANWKGSDADGPSITVDVTRDRNVRAVFRPIGLSRQHGLQQRGE